MSEVSSTFNLSFVPFFPTLANPSTDSAPFCSSRLLFSRSPRRTTTHPNSPQPPSPLSLLRFEPQLPEPQASSYSTLLLLSTHPTPRRPLLCSLELLSRSRRRAGSPKSIHFTLRLLSSFQRISSVVGFQRREPRSLVHLRQEQEREGEQRVERQERVRWNDREEGEGKT